MVPGQGEAITEAGFQAHDQMVNARKAEDENANAKAEASLKTVAQDAAEKKKGVQIPYSKC